MEFLSGIPGTIGGNIKMNAGCYGSQISDNLIDCTIIDEKLNKKIVKKNEIDFRYRKSSFNNEQIIIEARFKIQKKNKLQIKKKISTISNKRKKSQPVSSRTGGSTFTNPTSYSAWKLIDEIDYRGKQLGAGKSIKSSFKFSNKLYENATSLDLEMLGEEIKNKVWEKKKNQPKWELIRIGEFKKKSEKILVLRGGISEEKEISVLTANQVYKTLQKKYDTKLIDVDGDCNELIKDLIKLKPDKVFNCLHGIFGERSITINFKLFKNSLYTFRSFGIINSYE